MLIRRSIYPHTHAPSRNSNRAQIILLHFKCDSLFLIVYKSLIKYHPHSAIGKNRTHNRFISFKIRDFAVHRI